MERQASKQLSHPVDIPPASIDIDHETWDSTSYLAETFPDVIQDIESSLRDSRDDSTAVLLGFDLDLQSEVHHKVEGVSLSFKEISHISKASDMEMMEDMDDSRSKEGDLDEEQEDRGFLEVGSDDEMIVIDEENEDDDDKDAKDIERDSTNLQSGYGNGDCDGSLDEDREDMEEQEEEEEGGEKEGMEDWDSDSEGDLDALLDEGLPERYKKSKGDGELQSKERRKAGQVWRKVVTHGGALPEGLIGVKEKTVLKKHGQEPLEGLPDGWIRISHQCGMPLFLHRPTRVCTWSRPYLLGSGSARRHHIPVAAIPCLHYSRALERDNQAESKSNIKEEPQDPTAETTPKEDESPPDADPLPEGPTSDKKGEQSHGNSQPQNKRKIHICEDDSVDGKTLHEYLSRLFQFEKIAIKRFKSWADRRKYTKAVKTKDRPQFPGGPKVIRCQIPGNKGREFVINAQDKTPVCILHEYSQRVMRTQPQYVFRESKNASAPFEAIVEIQGVQYGRGEATSKRLAKAEAAKATLDILVPELISDIKPKTQADTEYFDHVAIDDSRIYDLCVKAGQLTPWQVLQEYRQRSHGMADTELKMDIKLKNHQRSEYTLTLGPHTVTGMCKNKTNGKQQGAQKLLKQLHPELSSWGAIIKMYGKGSSEINREKKEAELSVTELTHDTPRARPNRKILNKLRMEMMKTYGETGWLEEEMETQHKQVVDQEDDMDDGCTKDPS